MTFGLEMERVYPQRKRYAREEIKNLEKSEEKRINGQAYDRNTHTHTHIRLMALFPGLPR